MDKFLANTEILTPESLSDYKSIIEKRVNLIVSNGTLQAGNLIKQLHNPRRGGLLSGIHPKYAETTHEHSNQLEDAGMAFGYNENSRINYDKLPLLFRVHDHIDSIFFDITPHDNITLKMKEEMEDYGMNLLYSSLKNGNGHLMISYYQTYTSKKTKESEIAYFLDKQDAGTKSREIRNNIDLLKKFYTHNPEYQEFIFNTFPEAETLDAALKETTKTLERFYPYNIKRFDEGFMKEIAAQVENFKGNDVYTFYYNLLSTINPKDYE